MDTRYEVAKARMESAMALKGKPGERDALISALTANDPNGCYTDADMVLEFGQPSALEELRECLAEQWAEELCRDCGKPHAGDCEEGDETFITHLRGNQEVCQSCHDEGAED